VDGLIARPDGNNVSLDREGLNLAEAQLKFKTGVALLREEYQRVMDAIHPTSSLARVLATARERSAGGELPCGKRYRQ
jgi:hypothetical protein